MLAEGGRCRVIPVDSRKSCRLYYSYSMVPPLRGLEEEEDGAGGGGNEEEESLPDLDGPGVPLFPAEYVLAAV
jgi:hypothetical protein